MAKITQQATAAPFFSRVHGRVLLAKVVESSLNAGRGRYYWPGLTGTFGSFDRSKLSTWALRAASRYSLDLVSGVDTDAFL